MAEQVHLIVVGDLVSLSRGPGHSAHLPSAVRPPLPSAYHAFPIFFRYGLIDMTYKLLLFK